MRTSSKATTAGRLLAAAITMAAAPAFAAEPASINRRSSDVPIGVADWTASLESGPEWYATSRGNHKAGDYSDTYVAPSLSYAFAPDWALNGLFQATFYKDGTQQYEAEAGIAYTIQLGALALSPQAAIGDTWDATGLGESGKANAVYYALYLSADLTLNKQWSWTLFSVRWRDAFNYEWQTPALTTGIRYALSDAVGLNLDAGYSWLDKGEGMHGNDMHLAAAVSYSF